MKLSPYRLLCHIVHGIAWLTAILFLAWMLSGCALLPNCTPQPFCTKSTVLAPDYGLHRHPPQSAGEKTHAPRRR